jgi:hypothetical protein
MRCSAYIVAASGRGGRLASWEVPSSYRDYFGNQGFCYGIFRDITPIAAGQALGWEFRGFPAGFSGFGWKRRATAEEEPWPKHVLGKGFRCICR